MKQTVNFKPEWRMMAGNEAARSENERKANFINKCGLIRIDFWIWAEIKEPRKNESKTTKLN